jgi:predicted nucleic acid-binding protein
VNVAIDTNVLAYAEGLNGATHQPHALRIVRKLAPDKTVVPVQVLGELFHVLVRKGRWRADKARAAIEFWRGAVRVIDTRAELMLTAIGLASQHRLAIWDAVILSAAAHANCVVLLSEDLQDGFAWEGVTVCNPFLAQPHPLIAHLVRA